MVLSWLCLVACVFVMALVATNATTQQDFVSLAIIGSAPPHNFSD